MPFKAARNDWAYCKLHEGLKNLQLVKTDEIACERYVSVRTSRSFETGFRF